MTPLAAVQRERATATLPTTAGDRVAGYGVMGIPFESGEYLALRDWTDSSFGPPYRSIWHRDATGDWTIYSDAPPQQSCVRFLAPDVSHARTTTIGLAWSDDHTLVADVEAAELSWTITLAGDPMTRMLSAVAPAMPAWVWRSDAALRIIASSSAAMLRTGRLRLAGTMPNGQRYQLAPMHLWTVRHSTASIGPRDLGKPRPHRPQARIGDVTLPQRGVFYTAATGRFYDKSRTTNH
ncbi:hypothetical protein [Solicola gregarius]|uniref:Uncharacterized protein n=1 Tax=Solicola gregarius TaxID=2908642 RepID=A0AA46YLK6_9ACTN|nr:hypothetical protein [Solicola gregarius]UYM05684.1 hypothetical protein L0C25_00980 [Solicola gregarius]